MEESPCSQISEWLQTLKESRSRSHRDDPNYWTSNPETLLSNSHIETVVFGTGYTVWKNAILQIIAGAEQEVILVTCFWVRSSTLDALCETLTSLSNKALRRGKKVRVRICFSSLSIWQKLFHTFSLRGQVYPPSQWKQRMGLPEPEKLQGLEMEVKSIFVLPFSVTHPKFVIIDRKRVLLPSCNVSWENWFEGCVVLRGNKENQIVQQFVRFWSQFWARGEDGGLDANGDAFTTEDVSTAPPQHAQIFRKHTSFYWSIGCFQQESGWIKAFFLPSPHHQNPRFSIIPWRACPPPPPTPLNTFVLSALKNAKKHIYIQTPNLTAPPVLSALFDALEWGVSVTIVTSERLMILEQLVTAGTTTKRCIKKLVKRHSGLLNQHRRKAGDWTAAEVLSAARPGRLQVFFFQPDRSESGEGDAEPTQSHLKFMSVDEEWTVFGSGNMDRASWYTSQELDVAFRSDADNEEAGTRIGAHIYACMAQIMETRCSLYYDGRMDEDHPSVSETNDFSND